MAIRRFALGITLALVLLAIIIGVSNNARAATVCTPTSTVSGAYAQNGAGDVCFQTANLCSYINSWNLSALEVNGTDYTNRWVDSRTISQLNGAYIVHYVGSFPWSHFEIGGTCGTTPPPTTPPVTTPPPTTPPATTPPVTTPPPTTPPVTTPPPTTPPPGSVSINAGGSATGSFGADQYFSGGSTYTNTATIDVSQIPANTAPAAVFNTERYGAMTYTIPNRSGAQTVTLYFAETYVTAAGQRLFNVSINGATVLTSFDIFAAAGGANRAIARSFSTTANSSGQVVIQFIAGTQNPKINAITVAGGGGGNILTVTKNGSGSGSGTVTSSPAGINCGTTCSANYASGTSVTLSYSLLPNTTFGGWGGACSGTAATCTVSMTQSQAVTATFNSTLGSFNLTITKSGTGTGTVTSSPAGINCGSTCSASFASGASVTLTAQPASGSTFGGWSGACSGTGGCTVTMNTNQSVTATFNGSNVCQIGTTRGRDVAVIGDSFIALSHGITRQIETRAKAAGSLPQSEQYVDNSVSGSTLAGSNQIPSQYTRAVQSSGTIRFVLMDGGGNDCLINNNADAAYNAAQSLFQTMAQNRTEKIVYFFYPDPVGSQYASLKTCLDGLRPRMKALCDGLTSPQCYWLDLRSLWNGHPEYTSDGIHPTDTGSRVTGDAVWDVMKANCVAQ